MRHFLAHLMITSGFALASLSEVRASKPSPACDVAELKEAKAEFLKLRNLYRVDPDAVSIDEFRWVSNQYIFAAEECYQATHGNSVTPTQKIDDGGVWVSPSNSVGWPVRATGDVADRSSPRGHVLWGGKWGAGSPFLSTGSYRESPGPRIPGGTVTYSFMADGVDLSSVDAGSEAPDDNTAITSLATYAPCFLTEITNALDAWSAVADIQFVETTDGGGSANLEATGDIRIGAHTFDGASGTLAHAYFPPPNGLFLAGDVHFDIAEDWTCAPGPGDIDIGIVSLHEIGHAIGLRHEPDSDASDTGDLAMMNGTYNDDLDYGLLADDVIGAVEIYGGGRQGSAFFFGDMGIGTDSPTRSLHVQRDDGTARILVEETQENSAARILFQLQAAGPTRFLFSNTLTNKGWVFGQTTSNQFRISDTNAAGAEADSVELKLTPNGDLTITGDYFSTTCTTGTPCAPDYVFGSDYKLMPLEELAVFVQREKHLPNIPSAAELTGPVNVSKLQMKLLEKIEELTLYTLDQEEKLAAIQDLKQLVEQQKDEINSLRNELAELKVLIERISDRK